VKYEIRTNSGATTIHEAASDAEIVAVLDRHGVDTLGGLVATRLVPMPDGSVQRWQVPTPPHRRTAGKTDPRGAEFGLRAGAVGWTDQLDSKRSA
jgi:hypothetical protein